jgi:hypothetical protein
VGLFLRGYTARTAGPTAVVVGTVLSAVNQGGVLAAGHATPGTWLRIAVNYVVPFIVASIGYLSGRRTLPEDSTGTGLDD